MEATTVQVHQTVHGYRTGHQLLRTSRPLPSEVQRTMLVQSDLSGPSVVPGFEDYLTGYPLEEIGAFALARTWYAPEMDRPGCVWTHSLLIDFADLARLENLSGLARQFERPSRESVTAPAMLPLTVTSGTNHAPIPRGPIAASIVAALYGSPESVVVAAAIDATVLEPLVLRLWSQQWPRLRRSTRFCTGALSLRLQGNSPFDLLIVPIALRTQLRRDAPHAVFVEEAEAVEPYWMSITAQALNQDEAQRRFLWSYGADVKQARHAWRGLVDTFRLVSGSERPAADTLVSMLALDFLGRMMRLVSS